MRDNEAEDDADDHANAHEAAEQDECTAGLLVLSADQGVQIVTLRLYHGPRQVFDARERFVHVCHQHHCARIVVGACGLDHLHLVRLDFAHQVDQLGYGGVAMQGGGKTLHRFFQYRRRANRVDGGVTDLLRIGVTDQLRLRPAHFEYGGAGGNGRVDLDLRLRERLLGGMVEMENGVAGHQGLHHDPQHEQSRDAEDFLIPTKVGEPFAKHRVPLLIVNSQLFIRIYHTCGYEKKSTKNARPLARTD